MNLTPNWQAARDGRTTDPNAVNASAHVNQLLGTHGITDLYRGAALVTQNGGTQLVWYTPGNGQDVDQPFVMPGGKTAIGRVTIPILPSGNGADLLVQLWPDNGSGSPNTTGSPLASTYIPASWLVNLSATQGITAGGVLAVSEYNTLAGTGGIQTTSWAPPAGDSTGVASNASVVTSGEFMIFLGGLTSNPVGVVATAQYQGGTTLSLPVQQPSLPQASYYGGAAANSNTLILTGGFTTVAISTVWVASWDPNQGLVGSWSAQQQLPQTLWGMSTVISGSTVYVIGGYNGSSVQNTVYYTTITNGQVGAWKPGPQLPTATLSNCAAVINGWLIVAGGATVATSTPTSAVYYAKINSDGSLGAWQTGPSLPVAMYAYAPGWDVAVTDSAIVIVGGFTAPSTYTNAIQVLTVSADGPASTWQQYQWTEAFIEAVGAFSIGSGQWEIVNPIIASSIYRTATMTPTPMISVPLPATGLTAGATYHVLMQQNQRFSSSDYLAIGTLDASPLPNAALVSTRYSGTWSVLAATYSVPLSVYDNSTAGVPMHTWQDGVSGLASRTSTLVRSSTYKTLLGVCEATLTPDNPLNLNSTFASGVANWTATNCTFTQSSAQVHGGFAFSGLMTPNGTSATVFVESNKGPVPTNYAQGAGSNAEFYMQATSYVYSPTGYSSVSLSVNWYDSASNLLSTSSNVVSVPAATWTLLANFFAVPAGAAQATLVPTESGTPSASNTLFLSGPTLTAAPVNTGAMSSVAAVSYPSGANWPPTGVTQLA